LLVGDAGALIHPKIHFSVRPGTEKQRGLLNEFSRSSLTKNVAVGLPTGGIILKWFQVDELGAFIRKCWRFLDEVLLVNGCFLVLFFGVILEPFLIEEEFRSIGSPIKMLCQSRLDHSLSFKGSKKAHRKMAHLRA